MHSKLTPLVIVASLLLGVFAVRGAAARRGAADHRADGRRVRRDAGRVARRSGAARHASRSRSCSGRSPASSTSTRRPARAESMVVVRFHVGEDEEARIVRLNQKLAANFDLMPPGASPPLVKPRSIDDVPDPGADAVGRRLRRRRSCGSSPHSCTKRSRRSPDVSEVTHHRRPAARGPRRARSGARWPRYASRPARRAAARSPRANARARAGGIVAGNRATRARGGPLARRGRRRAPRGRRLVRAAGPCYLSDVADGQRRRREPDAYVMHYPRDGGRLPRRHDLPIAKRKGTNAIDVDAARSHAEARDDARRTSLPSRRAAHRHAQLRRDRRARSRTSCSSTCCSPSSRSRRSSG